MRQFVFLITLSTLLSCGQDSSKWKELELKEKELALKEKELQQKEKVSSIDTTAINAPTVVVPQATILNVTYQAKDISPNIDMSYYKGKNLIFYYDKNEKGKIIIDNITYHLLSEKRVDRGNSINYTYTGKNITIQVLNGKFEDIGDDEERDVYNAKFQTLKITTEKGSLEIKNVDLVYSVMSDM